jgi:hypothetical protein
MVGQLSTMVKLRRVCDFSVGQARQAIIRWSVMLHSLTCHTDFATSSPVYYNDPHWMGIRGGLWSHCFWHLLYSTNNSLGASVVRSRSIPYMQLLSACARTVPTALDD